MVATGEGAEFSWRVGGSCVRSRVGRLRFWRGLGMRFYVRKQENTKWEYDQS